MRCPKCDQVGIEVTTLSDSIRKYMCCNALCSNAMQGVVYDGDPQNFARAQAEDDRKLDEILKLWHSPD